MSQPTNEQWTAMTKLVESFYKRNDTEPFREPVAFKELGLFDYPQIIKTPMDLGTIKKKLKSRNNGDYKTLQQCAEDVRLVWSNCMTYNADGSDFFVLAQGLSKKWEDKYAKLLQDYGIQADASGGSGSGGTGNTSGGSSGNGGGGGTTNEAIVSLEEKRAFAKSLYKLTKEELGRILIELDQKCPQALLKSSSEDEMEMNVDKITRLVFDELKKYAEECQQKRSTKKGKGGSGPSSKKARVG
uniref:Bromo domain-containing protein n=1 Tax=Grammatophora oceanica TaxID=210454 RepID=A0A7S1V4M0_9STRA|mmetsp:Transcript_36533/g.54485  ORF Transcript_36533/g.54485 Transcript_36533/m.54485 type:complete len:243 (+) Transcript_36533:75-803(+)|eukprot:CAMPEP_0194028562 /NCGR_PEP_ID=MMETSP0009_2-20130614/2499_1 /TAXON_ID=210454 /ORGANISM="Grammatophora oceanica, Strain CCMP 410" /LENGTH=242 /DNA_ID=CAMNT_0038667989 /DNA_START=69 /DNA_END=797 /DNA_ORIENTATION=+